MQEHRVPEELTVSGKKKWHHYLMTIILLGGCATKARKVVLILNS